MSLSTTECLHPTMPILDVPDVDKNLTGTSISSMLPTPHCHNMVEHPSAAIQRLRLQSSPRDLGDNPDLSAHILHGLAYTIGSALECSPPSIETCLDAFLVENKAKLTAGSRAWSKHSHRSNGEKASNVAKNVQETEVDEICIAADNNQKLEHEKTVTSKKAKEASLGWWGVPSGPVAKINENSLQLFWKVMNGATWRNLHWLPHQILVYEVRVPAGYGMRWSQDRSEGTERQWIFRGCLEPQMENGHEVGWRH